MLATPMQRMRHLKNGAGQQQDTTRHFVRRCHSAGSMPSTCDSDLTHLHKHLSPQQRRVHFVEIQLLQTGACSLHQIQTAAFKLEGCVSAKSRRLVQEKCRALRSLHSRWRIYLQCRSQS